MTFSNNKAVVIPENHIITINLFETEQVVRDYEMTLACGGYTTAIYKVVGDFMTIMLDAYGEKSKFQTYNPIFFQDVRSTYGPLVSHPLIKKLKNLDHK